MSELEMLERLYEKVEQVAQDQSEMKVTLAGQAVQLEEHVRRSTTNETNLELLRKEFKPIQIHVAAVNGVFKAIAILGSVVAIIKATIGTIKLFP